MDEAPHHESPIGPMPKPRDQEDDEGVSNGLPFPNTGPPKWDVQVIAEPRGQGDVPSPPKFSDVTGEIGRFKIRHQANAKEPCGPNGDVAVPTEISINLEGKTNGAKHQSWSAVILVVVEDVVDKNGTRIRNDDFLEHAPEDEPQSADGKVMMKSALFLHLWQQSARTLDGPSHELRKKTDKGSKVQQGVRRLELPAVNVDGVAQRLESVKADANWQDELQGGGMHLDPQGPPGIDPALDEKVGVFEVPQEAEIDGQRDGQPFFCPVRSVVRIVRIGVLVRFVDSKSYCPIDQCAERDERQKTPIPPTIKNVT